MSVKKEQAMNNASENYRRTLEHYYTKLEKTSERSGETPAGMAVNKLLNECLDLASPHREQAFVDGILALSFHEDLQWMPKAA